MVISYYSDEAKRTQMRLGGNCFVSTCHNQYRYMTEIQSSNNTELDHQSNGYKICTNNLISKGLNDVVRLRRGPYDITRTRRISNVNRGERTRACYRAYLLTSKLLCQYHYCSSSPSLRTLRDQAVYARP